MFNLEILSRKISDYRAGLLTIAQFQEWFEDKVTADVYDDPQLHEACAAVGSALVELHFDGIGEAQLKAELAKALRAFARSGLVRGLDVNSQGLDLEIAWSDSRSTSEVGDLREAGRLTATT